MANDTPQKKLHAIKALRNKLMAANLGEHALFPSELQTFDELFADAIAQTGVLKGMAQFPKTEVRTKIPPRLKVGEVFIAKGRPLDAVLPFKVEEPARLKPSIYSFMDPDTGMITISAYADGDPMWELNHIELCELRHGKVNKHSSVMNILRNVLTQAGINFVQE